MTKPTKWHVRPAKTQISLSIRPVWSESSLSPWIKLGSLATHWACIEDSDQTWRMPRLIWVFAGFIVICLFCHEAAHVFYFSTSSLNSPALCILTAVFSTQALRSIFKMFSLYFLIIQIMSLHSKHCVKSVKRPISPRYKTNGPRQANLVLIAYASSKGAG